MSFLTEKRFDLEQAFKVQKEQLKEWKSILKPSKFALLKAYVEIVNKNVTDPYRVFRGTDITNWVFNNLMER